MNTLLMSLLPRYYHQLVIAQTKKFEYRRGRFYAHAFRGFIYSTLSQKPEDRNFPGGEIGALITFGEPIIGIEKMISIKEQQEPGSEDMMREWLRGHETAYTYPVEQIKVFSAISLENIRQLIPGFNPPQKYFILEKKPALLDLLEEQSDKVPPAP